MLGLEDMQKTLKLNEFRPERSIYFQTICFINYTLSS